MKKMKSKKNSLNPLFVDSAKNPIISHNRFYVGLSDGTIPDDDNLFIGEYQNSYGHSCYEYCLAGERRLFAEEQEAIEAREKSNGMDVYGCGLVLDPEDKLAIFFTLNGQLMGELMLKSLRINQKIVFPSY
jgi:hypothetical protein